MGKSKFINRKNSATFQLLARDSSDPIYSSPSGPDHVFVRVDNNPYAPYAINAFSEDQQPDDEVSGDDPNSIFADAPDDYDADEDTSRSEYYNQQIKPLPDHVRKEIIELGFPDDGYNYLTHMRDIKNAGVSSVYYQNPKANIEPLKPDVKNVFIPDPVPNVQLDQAYNAKKVDISKVDEERDEKEIYAVVSKASEARVEKVVDDEINALLDDSDLSRFGSDVDDLEEDFVVKANLPEGPVDLDLERDTKKSTVSMTGKSDVKIPGANVSGAVNEEIFRVPRPLDKQFETLLLQEYGTDSEDGYEGCDDHFDENGESLADKLNNAFKFHSINDLEQDGKGMATSNILQSQKKDDVMELPEVAADVIKRCKEYGENYENEDEQEVIFEESSDESDKWDCETVVSTYSNFDNLPGKIEAPETRRKKKLAEKLSGVLSSEKKIISLGGKEKLPLDFLPHARSHSANKVKEEHVVKPELARKKHGQESKEEKKERKAAVKEDKREARRVKKEIKELYKGEAEHAQRVAASSGPSSFHIM